MKKTVKRLGFLLLALALATECIGCGGSSDSSDTLGSSKGSSVSASNTEEDTTWDPKEPIHIVGQSDAGSGPDLFTGGVGYCNCGRECGRLWWKNRLYSGLEG